MAGDVPGLRDHPMTIDALRYEAERMLAEEGWSDAVACIVWGLRSSVPGGGGIQAGRLDAERLIADPGRVAQMNPPRTWAIAWAVEVADPDAY